jgi:hypothetical protein
LEGPGIETGGDNGVPIAEGLGQRQGFGNRSTVTTTPFARESRNRYEHGRDAGKERDEFLHANAA